MMTYSGRCSLGGIWLFLMLRVQAGLYITADYYLDPSQSDAFGGACEENVQDDSLLVNSHLNPFNLINYGNNKDCWMVLDAGTMAGARYRLKMIRFSLEEASEEGACMDYLALYNGKGTDQALHDKYCGSELPNITDFVTQRYLTIQFHSDSQNSFKGFQLLAVRTEPAPCQDEEFRCPHEDRCIPDDLHCDGTEHCLHGDDEFHCSDLDKFIGFFLSQGLGGIVAIGVCVVGGLVMICTLIVCIKCCKKDKMVSPA